jgi:hypothetical protein
MGLLECLASVFGSERFDATDVADRLHKNLTYWLLSNERYLGFISSSFQRGLPVKLLADKVADRVSGFSPPSFAPWG